MSANLVIQTAFLGDLLLSVPLLKRIKRLWPEDELIVVTRSGVGSLLKQLGIVDAVYEVKKGQGQSYKSVQSELQKYQFRNIFSPHESLRTCFFLRGLKAENKIGFKKFARSLFFNQLVVKPQRLPDAIRQLSLLTVFDAELQKQIETIPEDFYIKKNQHSLLEAPPEWASMALSFTQEAAQSLFQNIEPKFESILKVSKPVIAVFPGSVWATKRWTLDHYIELVKELSSQYHILLMGGPGEEELTAKISQVVSETVDLCGKTSLLESFYLLRKSQFVVGNDSASMHLASLAGIPVYAFFGPTVLAQGFRPWNSKTVIIEKTLSCRPCGRHGHNQCPIGTHECMKSLKPEEALRVILQSSPLR